MASTYAIKTIMARDHQCSITFTISSEHGDEIHPDILRMKQEQAMARAETQIEKIVKDAANYTVSYGKWYPISNPTAEVQIYTRDFSIHIHG